MNRKQKHRKTKRKAKIILLFNIILIVFYFELLKI